MKKGNRIKKMTWLMLAAFWLMVPIHSANAAEPAKAFYQDRGIRFVVGFAPGGAPGRIAGFALGVIAGWAGVVLRLTLLPDTTGGRALSGAIVLTAVVILGVNNALGASPLAGRAAANPALPVGRKICTFCLWHSTSRAARRICLPVSSHRRQARH
jgi:hypothetical protein